MQHPHQCPDETAAALDDGADALVAGDLTAVQHRAAALQRPVPGQHLLVGEQECGDGDDDGAEHPPVCLSIWQHLSGSVIHCDALPSMCVRSKQCLRCHCLSSTEHLQAGCWLTQPSSQRLFARQMTRQQPAEMHSYKVLAIYFDLSLSKHHTYLT